MRRQVRFVRKTRDLRQDAATADTRLVKGRVRQGVWGGGAPIGVQGQSSDKRSGDKSPEAGDILQMEESKVLKRSWRGFYTVHGRRGRRGEAVRPAHQCLQSVGSERRCRCQTDSFNEHITHRYTPGLPLSGVNGCRTLGRRVGL